MVFPESLAPDSPEETEAAPGRALVVSTEAGPELEAKATQEPRANTALVEAKAAPISLAGLLL